MGSSWTSVLKSVSFFEIPVIGTGGPVEDIPTNHKKVFFPGCESREWATKDGHSIDVVMGMDNADLFPMPLAWRDSLILSKSVLSNLLIVWGKKERVQHLDLGPLEVNELMPEAHLFNQSSADISIVFQELSEDVLPSAPVDVLPSAPVNFLPSEQQVKVDVSPTKVLSKPLPWVASLIFFSFFWYLCSLGGSVEAFTKFNCPIVSLPTPSLSLSCVMVMLPISGMSGKSSR